MESGLTDDRPTGGRQRLSGHRHRDPVVPSSQGHLGERAGHPWGGMATAHGSVRRAADAPTQIPRTPQAGDLGEEVGRSPALGWGPGHR